MQVRLRQRVLMLRLALILAILLPQSRKPQPLTLTNKELALIASPIRSQNQLEGVRENFASANSGKT